MKRQIAIATTFLLAGILLASFTPDKMPTPILFMFVAGESFLIISAKWS